MYYDFVLGTCMSMQTSKLSRGFSRLARNEGGALVVGPTHLHVTRTFISYMYIHVNV